MKFKLILAISIFLSNNAFASLVPGTYVCDKETEGKKIEITITKNSIISGTGEDKDTIDISVKDKWVISKDNDGDYITRVKKIKDSKLRIDFAASGVFENFDIIDENVTFGMYILTQKSNKALNIKISSVDILNAEFLDANYSEEFNCIKK